MQNDRDSDHSFADQALARLHPVEPSADLARRVAEIPLRRLEDRRSWLDWTGWPARLLLLGALAAGAATGALSWEDVQLEDDGELEGALSLALGGDRMVFDLSAEDSL